MYLCVNYTTVKAMFKKNACVNNMVKVMFIKNAKEHIYV